MLTKRQAEIIEKSILIIDEKGIQGLTIKSLSKAIGISEPRYIGISTANLIFYMPY